MTTAPGQSSSYQYERYDDQTDNIGGGAGLAAWLLILGGIWSFFTGLELVTNSAYIKSQPGYSSIANNYNYFWNLSGWGTADLILGILAVAAGILILFGQTWARWAGLVLAVLSGVGYFLFLPIHPLWSIIVILINVFIVCALATAGRRQYA